MPLKSDTLPNKALLGTELRAIAVKQFDEMLSRDYAFAHTVAYRSVAITIEATFHLGKPHEPHVVKSYTKPDGLITGGVPLPEICQCSHSREQHSGHTIMVGEPDRDNCSACDCEHWNPEDAVLVSLERKITLDNPNLARVHHDLPIKISERKPPQPIPYENQLPGEPPPPFMLDPYPQMQTTEIRYDPKDYPPLDPPVDRDVSDAKAEQLGVKKRGTGMGLMKERKG